jgi:hypothetical protein
VTSARDFGAVVEVIVDDSAIISHQERVPSFNFKVVGAVNAIGERALPLNQTR